MPASARGIGATDAEAAAALSFFSSPPPSFFFSPPSPAPLSFLSPPPSFLPGATTSTSRLSFSLR